MTDKELVIEAINAMKNSYSPYSDFKVGAALLTANGKVYTGCNIENVAFGPSICAERVAFFQAVHNGHLEFSAIAIVGGPKGSEISALCTPCGVCRQVMSEFCKGEFNIILSDGKTNSVFTLDDMLPHRFAL